MTRFSTYLFALMLLGAGCSSSGPAAERRNKKEPDREVDLSEYEDFDPAPYREQPPAERVTKVEHDVPKTLMEGQAAAGQLVTRQGFRIQLFSSINRDEASEKRNQFGEWVRKDSTKNQGIPEMPTYMKYKQPYYRVRVGNFTSRAQAEQVLSRLKEEFDSAFVVPSTVQVRR